MTKPYILVLYYSRYGATRQMAEAIAQGIEAGQCFEARCRTVATINPSHQVDDQTIPESGHLLATLEDLTHMHGLAMGSPTRFGNMAAPLKYFLETTSGLWMNGDLDGKPACVFTSTSSMHGGQESTLLSMMLPLFHHGMVMVGSSYSEPELGTTQSGGTPYGPSHLAGVDSRNPISQEEKKLCIAQGKRLASMAKRLAEL